MPTDSDKSKRRRFVRYATELDALLIIGKTKRVPCTILDFCSGGFFLALNQPGASIPLDKTVKIHFTIASELGSDEDFEIEARAVHATANGIGVAIDNMPLAAFSALTNQASVSLLGDQNLDRHAPPLTLSQKNCKRALKRLLQEQLPLLLGRYFDSLADELEKINEHSEYFANRSLLDDIATALNLQREPFIREYCGLLTQQIDNIVTTSARKAYFEASYDALSLVDKDEFEDWLAMSAFIRKLNNYFEDSIKQLDLELSRVFGLSTMAINNPLRPAVLCDSFRDIILQQKYGNKIREALYISFEQSLIRQLKDVYEKAAALLVDYESSQEIRRYSPYQAHKPGDTHSRPTQKPRLPDFEQVTPSRLEDYPALISDHGFHEATTGDIKNIQPIGKIASKLLGIINELDTLAPGAIAKESGAVSYPCFNSTDVISAISNLQRVAANDHALHLDSTALNNRLQQTLKQVGKGNLSLSKNDLEYLEIYGKFFEALFNNLPSSSVLKSYLEKIHLPLLSLPLQGNDFLDLDEHPARNVLNQLALLESAIKSNKVIRNVNIKNKVDSLVERIAQEAGGNPEVFNEVERELETIAKQVNKSTDSVIKRIVDTHDGQQKLESARLAVQDEIDRRIEGRSVPTIIPRLLTSGWQQLLVIAELNKEKRPEEKQRYWAVIDDLLFWFFEQDSILKIQAGSIHKTLEFIEHELKPVCPDSLQRHSIIEELSATLLGVGTPKVRKRFETVKIEPKAAPPEPEVNSWLLQVEQLAVGDWLMISLDALGFEPMKLVWIGDVIPVYVFVNRDGLLKQEFDKMELAERLKSGDAYNMENLDAPLMERATNSMLQNMHGKLIHNATHDPTTDLFTRDEFIKQLKNEMVKIGDSRHMLCHMEVLDFRLITNVCGVEGGEQLLKRLSQLTIERLRDYDLFARLGDKAFGILFKNCSAEEGHDKSKKLIKLINDSHFQWEEKSFAISVSIGLAHFDENSFDVHELLRQADSASISAERSGQNNVLIFTSDNEALKRQHKLYEWIGHIDQVFAQNRLFARCQMIAPIEAGKSSHQHYEILLGVRDENGNIIPPDHFIPAVERCNRMPELDQWVINNVFDWIEENPADFDKMDGFSINLSGQSINSEDFLEFLRSTLENRNIPKHKLTFEVTETVASENLGFTNRFIKSIKQFGCKFSLDDFGSGYSSYSYLKNLNVDFLKIDGAFVKDIANNKADIAIVKSMNEIAHSLGLKTIAEYVENAEIRTILTEIGVDFGQGYEIHKPIPLAELVIQEAPASGPTYLFEDDSFWNDL